MKDPNHLLPLFPVVTSLRLFYSRFLPSPFPVSDPSPTDLLSPSGPQSRPSPVVQQGAKPVQKEVRVRTTTLRDTEGERVDLERRDRDCTLSRSSVLPLHTIPSWIGTRRPLAPPVRAVDLSLESPDGPSPSSGPSPDSSVWVKPASDVLQEKPRETERGRQHT